MSKQLSLSAAVSIFAMAAFALFATPTLAHRGEAGAPTSAVAPALKASLKAF